MHATTYIPWLTSANDERNPASVIGADITSDAPAWRMEGIAHDVDVDATMAYR